MITYHFLFTSDRAALEGHDPDLDIKATGNVLLLATKGELPEDEWEQAVAQAKRQVRDALSEQARALRDAANKFLLENDPLGAGEKTE
jgi:hypothetical protein